MKRLLLTSVSVLALTSGQPALAAAPSFSWTGFYVGINAGAGWGRTTLSDPEPGFLAGALTDFEGTSVTANSSGFLGGGQIGFNYQFAPGWIFGLEGQFSGADISGTFNGFSGTSFHTKTNWLASVTGRLGYAMAPNWLAYVKGGAAWAHDKYDVSYLGTWSASDTRTGWTVGGGLEWAFAGDWSASFEYQFYDFGTRTLDFNPSDSPFFFTPSSQDVKQQIHTVKLGINYRFGPH